MSLLQAMRKEANSVKENTNKVKQLVIKITVTSATGIVPRTTVHFHDREMKKMLPAIQKFVLLYTHNITEHILSYK
jgi:hypothetical protein